MPAPARYEQPHTQMLRLAELAKSRGLSFEEWWVEAMRPRWCRHCELETLQPDCPRCLRRTQGPAPVLARDHPLERPPGAVVWPTDTNDRRTSLAAADEAKEGWRRAWEGRPRTRPEEAVVLLARALRDAEEAFSSAGNDAGFAVA